MKIKLDTGGLGQSKWHEYVARFAFGGLVTALAGMIARKFGPGVGGLFLAFPAIFPASATLIDKHEKQKKERAGKDGSARGRSAAGVDAAGAGMGSVGLATFALIVWQRLPHSSMILVLAIATLAWFMVSVSVWHFRETIWRKWARRRTPLANRLHAVGRQSPSAIRRLDEQEKRSR